VLLIWDNVIFRPSFFVFSKANKCYDIGEETSVASKQLAPNSGTYLCSMQGSACGAWILEGMFPLRV
jgi:hypothetical protein